jgi:hypothetical protein
MDKIDILNEKIIKNRTELIQLEIKEKSCKDNKTAKILIFQMQEIDEELVELEKQLQIELESI